MGQARAKSQRKMARHEYEFIRWLDEANARDHMLMPFENHANPFPPAADRSATERPIMDRPGADQVFRYGPFRGPMYGQVAERICGIEPGNPGLACRTRAWFASVRRTRPDRHLEHEELFLKWFLERGLTPARPLIDNNGEIDSTPSDDGPEAEHLSGAAPYKGDTSAQVADNETCPRAA